MSPGSLKGKTLMGHGAALIRLEVGSDADIDRLRDVDGCVVAIRILVHPVSEASIGASCLPCPCVGMSRVSKRGLRTLKAVFFLHK